MTNTKLPHKLSQLQLFSAPTANFSLCANFHRKLSQRRLQIFFSNFSNFLQELARSDVNICHNSTKLQLYFKTDLNFFADDRILHEIDDETFEGECESSRKNSANFQFSQLHPHETSEAECGFPHKIQKTFNPNFQILHTNFSNFSQSWRQIFVRSNANSHTNFSNFPRRIISPHELSHVNFLDANCRNFSNLSKLQTFKFF